MADDEEKVTREEEQEAVSKFLQSHKLEHPCVISPKTGEMHSAFGVTGIPHVILIDRKGDVRLVKTGAGKSSADEIQKMVETLLSEEVEK